MRRIAITGMLLLAGCAAPTVVTVPTSQQAVTAIELEYVNKFLVPAAAYTMLPHCPKPQGTPCSDPALIAKLRDTQIKLHDSIYALRDFSDASPQADAGGLIANARKELAAAELMIPVKGASP